MTYLLATYWLPLLLALLVGAATGFLTFARPGTGWLPRSWPGWLKLLGLLFLAGIVVAALRLLPGAAGLWLETALLLIAAYFIGVFLGSWLASVSGDAQTGSEPTAGSSPAPAAAAPVAAPVAATPAAAPVVATLPAEPAAEEAEETEEAAAAAPAGEEGHPGARPAGVAAPSGQPDDLQRIAGIGPKNERLLHGLGIYHFHQIAAWTEDNIAWVNSYLSFKGRIEREDWVGQAKAFAAEK